jgi:hypothetical protein
MYSNCLELAEAHCIELQQILPIIGGRGLRVDKNKLTDFCGFLDEEMAKLQLKFDSDPELLPYRGFHPKEGYKKVPKDLTGLSTGRFLVMPKEGFGPTEVVRWFKLLPFLASSSQQVVAYMKGKGHPVPKVKGTQTETSGAKALLLMWRRYKDDHYRDFVEYRKLKKMRSTYGAWGLEERDGLHFITTTYTLKPETGRLSSVGE